MRFATAVSFLLLLSLPSFGQGGADTSDTPEQAAGEVLAAFGEKNGEALKTLALRDSPGP